MLISFYLYLSLLILSSAEKFISSYKQKFHVYVFSMSLGALSSSQFPVFTLYAQKVCLSGHCDRAWDYERVPDFKIKAKGQELTKKQRKTGSRTACMELCLSERDFVCR